MCYFNPLSWVLQKKVKSSRVCNKKNSLRIGMWDKGEHAENEDVKNSNGT